MFDFDRTKHGTKRQVPLGRMRPDVGKVTATGKAKQGNPHYNKEYDVWIAPLVDTVERIHDAKIGDLAKRRHIGRSRANEANARAVVEREFLRSLEAKELEVAVLRVHGNRMKKTRYGRDRNLRCKESNAEQGARRALMTEGAKMKNRMGSIDTWTFGEGGHAATTRPASRWSWAARPSSTARLSTRGRYSPCKAMRTRTKQSNRRCTICRLARRSTA